MYKKINILIIATALCMLAASCTDSKSPSGIAESFLHLMVKGDFDKAIEFYAANSEDGSMILMFKDKIKASLRDDKIKSYKIVSEEISDDGKRATVTYTTISSNGNTKSGKVKFVKRDGVWKIKDDYNK
ncbi:MAG: DUF4878 domain-containing protein [Tannerella sp.]|jgi:hypothetical protein|nr:DUF4878 domain-containing protein [Tannerella sp.]